MHPRSCLFLSAALFLPTLAHAQQTQSHTGEIPMQLTNFTGTVTLPKFDPALGQLLSVAILVEGFVEGSTRIESLDNAPSIVTTRFAVDMAASIPGVLDVMFMVPVAEFADALLPFDGLIDFAGTSGVTHPDLQVSDSAQVDVAPTPGNLALYTGPGTVGVFAVAVGGSVAMGAGNLLTQFETHARVAVKVTYSFLGNTPPSVDCPGPLMASVGVPIQFQVCATDADAGDVVTLNGVLPAGAVANPPFPVVGNSACTTITWTPDSAQIGTFPFTFTANDVAGSSSTCTAVVTSAECHMVFGLGGGGTSSVTLFGHLYDTQLTAVRLSFPVTMADHPSFPFHVLPPVATMQVLMHNPQIFPDNPNQWSRALTFVRHPDGILTTSTSGTRNGIDVVAEVYQVGGQTRVRFPFTIDGM